MWWLNKNKKQLERNEMDTQWQSLFEKIEIELLKQIKKIMDKMEKKIYKPLIEKN